MLDGEVLEREPDDAEDIERALEYHRPYLYPGQLAAIFDPHRYSVIEASAQPLDTIIQTPHGPRRFGSLQVGDQVFAVDGSVTNVTGVFPKGRQPVYRLTFTGGATTRASGDHLWSVDHYRDGPKVLTTDQLLALAPNSRQLLRFPLPGPAQYPHHPVPIDPWLLGVLIGDGCLCSNVLSISSADPEIIARARNAVPRGYTLRQSGEYLWNIVPRVRGAAYERRSNIRFKANGYEVAVTGRYIGRSTTMEGAVALRERAIAEHYGEDVPETNLRRVLRALGLLGLKHDEKFIPDLYLRNSPQVMAEILRGLMDTDGSAGRRGSNGAVIEQTSERLAMGIQEIARSLGAICRIAYQPARSVKWKDSWRCNIRSNDPGSLFWLPRKRGRYAAGCSHKVVRKIISIERITDDVVQCISVDHPSKLYITDNWIVTHNTKAGKTSGCIVWLIEQAMEGEDGFNYWWVAPVSGQADIAFRRALRCLPQDMATAHLTLKTITLFNGAIIWFKSGDKPDSLYGDDVHAAVVDEASRLKEDAWFAVRSTLTHTKGPVRIIGNVKGRRNWFYRMARRAEQESGTGAMAYHKLTAYHAIAAGVLDAEEVEDAKSVLPDHVFRALYLAEPSDDDGNPFGLKAIAACIAPLSIAPPRCWGWDLAKKQDFTVGIALDLSGVTCRFERWQRIPWGDTMERIIRFTGRIPALVDSTGLGDPIVDMLQKKPGTRFEGYQFTAPSKQKLMEGLAVAIQSKTVRFPDGPIRRELEEFEYNYTKTGVRYSAPDGFFDDCVMALALAEYHKLHTKPPLVISDDVLARSGVPQARMS